LNIEFLAGFLAGLLASLWVSWRSLIRLHEEQKIIFAALIQVCERLFEAMMEGDEEEDHPPQRS